MQKTSSMRLGGPLKGKIEIRDLPIMKICLTTAMNYDGNLPVPVFQRMPSGTYSHPSEDASMGQVYHTPQRVCVPPAEPINDGMGTWVPRGPGQGSSFPTSTVQNPSQFYTVPSWGNFTFVPCTQPPNQASRGRSRKQKGRKNPASGPRSGPNEDRGEHSSPKRQENPSKKTPRSPQKGKCVSRSWAEPDNDGEGASDIRPSSRREPEYQGEPAAEIDEGFDENIIDLVGTFRQTTLQELHVLKELVKVLQRDLSHLLAQTGLRGLSLEALPDVNTDDINSRSIL